MIDVLNVSKSFGRLEVLHDVTLHVDKGDTVAIVGPSGSGKSTLLRCMNLLETPTHGQVVIDGVDITKPGTDINRIRQNIGMVFQHFHLFPHMTVMENMTYAPVVVKRSGKDAARQKALDLLTRVGLAEKADTYPSRLSGGQKQRVAIARSLAMEPEVMLFDEPTSALDPEMVKEVLEVIRGLAHTGITMAIVTHEMGFAREVADRICFFDEGRLVEQSVPDVFFSRPQTDRARQFLEKIL